MKDIYIYVYMCIYVYVYTYNAIYSDFHFLKKFSLVSFVSFP